METVSPIRAYQWTLIGFGMMLFALWEWFDHLWLMHVPMNLRHSLQIAGTTLILLFVTFSVFTVIVRYEQRLRSLNVQLQQQNAALERLEATRDARLLDLAKNLSVTLADLTMNAQFVLQSAERLPDIVSLSAAIDRAERLSTISHDLLQLSEMKPDTLPLAGEIHTTG